MGELLEKLKAERSNNVLIAYNNKVVSMGYVGSEEKKQFRYGAMRIQDNLCTGGYTETVGYLKTPKGRYYLIEKGKRTAKEISDAKI